MISKLYEFLKLKMFHPDKGNINILPTFHLQEYNFLSDDYYRDVTIN